MHCSWKDDDHRLFTSINKDLCVKSDNTNALKHGNAIVFPGIPAATVAVLLCFLFSSTPVCNALSTSFHYSNPPSSLLIRSSILRGQQGPTTFRKFVLDASNKFNIGIGRSGENRSLITSRLFQSSTPSQSPPTLKRTRKKNLTLPLLLDTDRTTDVEKEDEGSSMVIPLPSSHLPEELCTLSLHKMELSAPIHKMMVKSIITVNDEISENGMGLKLGDTNDEALYGHVTSLNTFGDGIDMGDLLVGAVGCVAQVLIAAPTKTSSGQDKSLLDSDGMEFGGIGDESKDDIGTITALARGRFRFVVREVVQTFPFPVAIVDELLDDDNADSISSLLENPAVPQVEELGTYDDDDDDDDDDYLDNANMYTDLPPSTLIQRVLQSTRTLIDRALEDSQPRALTLLEQSIIEGREEGSISAKELEELAQRNRAEEMAAIHDIFTSSLIDIAPTPVERNYAVAMMAADIACLNQGVRREILDMVDGVKRLRVVLREVEMEVGMGQARRLSEEIGDKVDEDSKDLLVGKPAFPPWAKSISKGTRIEYYWNDEYEWCAGTVIDEPVMIVDELILTIRFDDQDGEETYRLPFQADEKARWRPGGMR